MSYCDIWYIWTYITIDGYEEKDVVSVLHYNFKHSLDLKVIRGDCLTTHLSLKA